MCIDRLLFTHEYFVVSEVFFGFAIVLTTAITLIVIPKYVAEGPRNLTYRALGHGILAGMYGGVPRGGRMRARQICVTCHATHCALQDASPPSGIAAQPKHA